MIEFTIKKMRGVQKIGKTIEPAFMTLHKKVPVVNDKHELIFFNTIILILSLFVLEMIRCFRIKLI